MEDFVYYAELFAIYKDLLNLSNCKYYSLYYEENLSLQEIAELEKVSKSYVGNIINKTTKKLAELEDVLKVYEHKQLLRQGLKSDDIKNIKKVIESIL